MILWKRGRSQRATAQQVYLIGPFWRTRLSVGQSPSSNPKELRATPWTFCGFDYAVKAKDEDDAIEQVLKDNPRYEIGAAWDNQTQRAVLVVRADKLKHEKLTDSDAFEKVIGKRTIHVFLRRQ